MSAIQTNPDALLTREQTSQTLKAFGMPLGLREIEAFEKLVHSTYIDVER